jgi:lipopolysaccharide heptosyltransferase I
VKILILKPSSLGDVVQALPVLRMLKRHFCDAEIHWWIDSRLASLLEHDPDLASVIPFERRGWAARQYWVKLWRKVRWLRGQSFDIVIDLQSLARSGAFAWLANGAFTIGLDEPREGARGFYDVVVPRPTYYTHAVDWYLGALKFLNVPVHWNFEWLPTRADVAGVIKTKWPVNDSQWIAIQPGARWLNKRWPAEHYAEVVRRLAASERDLRFAIFGAADDRELARSISAAAPKRCLDLSGQLTLPELVEWIRLSQLLITNDTGPMHIAAALGKPVIALFGPTEPRRTGPYGQLDRVLQTSLPCVPCMKARCTYPEPLECLRSISPFTVLEHVRQQLHTSDQVPDVRSNISRGFRLSE